jgi:hypothetical protein
LSHGLLTHATVVPQAFAAASIKEATTPNSVSANDQGYVSGFIAVLLVLLADSWESAVIGCDIAVICHTDTVTIFIYLTIGSRAGWEGSNVPMRTQAAPVFVANTFVFGQILRTLPVVRPEPHSCCEQCGQHCQTHRIGPVDSAHVETPPGIEFSRITAS